MKKKPKKETKKITAVQNKADLPLMFYATAEIRENYKGEIFASGRACVHRMGKSEHFNIWSHDNTAELDFLIHNLVKFKNNMIDLRIKARRMNTGEQK